MTPSEVARIAAGLSEAQRFALEWTPPAGWQGRVWAYPQTGRVLHRKGLTVQSEYWMELTPLGLAVRQQLIKENSDG